MAVDTAAPLPPRGARGGGGRRNLIGLAIGVLLVILIVIGLRYAFQSSKPEVQPVRESTARGLAMTAKPVAVQVPTKEDTKPPPQQRVNAKPGKPFIDNVLYGSMNPQNEDGSAGGNSGVAANVAAAAKAEAAPDTGREDALSASLKPSNLGGPAIGELDTGYLYKIRKGTKVPCWMDVDVNSQLPGIVTCDINVGEGIWNKTNSAMLIPKGSHVMGVLRDDVRYGNDRVPVLWQTLETSDIPPCDVDVNSPAADEIGQAGYHGAVNNHFWATLFATAVYSLVEWAPAVGIAALQNGQQHGGSSVYFNSYGLTQPGQSMAGRMLQREMERPPTLEGRHAKLVMIVFARDVDMHKCINLRMARF